MHAGPERHGRTRRLFTERTLPVQFALLGSAVAALLAGLAGWLVRGPEGASIAAGAAGGALVVTLAATLLARRVARGLDRVEATARALRQDGDAATRHFALDPACAESQRATLALQRLVDAHRERVQALLASNLALGQRLSHRTHELSTLQDLSIGLATQSGLHELVDEALGALEQTVEYASASVWARDADSAEARLLGYRSAAAGDARTEDLRGQRLSRQNMEHYRQIERSREAIIVNHSRQNLLSWLWAKVVDDARSSSLYRATRAWMALPLRFRDEVLGVLRVDHHEQGYFDAERAKLLKAIGSQAALAMHHAKLQEQERAVAVVAERNRIARELHDAVSQTLFAANVQAGTLAKLAGRPGALDAAALARQAQALERLTRGALAEMRLLMYELRPDALRNTRLADLLQHAIGALQCRGEFEVAQRLAEREPLSDAVRTHVYRIAQEAISNAARHSGARHIAIEWTVEAPASATLRVVDDGRGFDPAQPRPGHFGLDNMQSRATEIGAALSVTSTPGQGSEVRLVLPLAEAGAAPHPPP